MGGKIAPQAWLADFPCFSKMGSAFGRRWSQRPVPWVIYQLNPFQTDQRRTGATSCSFPSKAIHIPCFGTHTHTQIHFMTTTDQCLLRIRISLCPRKVAPIRNQQIPPTPTLLLRSPLPPSSPGFIQMWPATRPCEQVSTATCMFFFL